MQQIAKSDMSIGSHQKGGYHAAPTEEKDEARTVGEQRPADAIGLPARRRPINKHVSRLLGLTLIAAFAGMLWLIYWPQFEGTYVGDAGKLAVEVVSTAAGKQVSISDSTTLPTSVLRFDAESTRYELRFGSGLEQQAIVYQPFTSRYILVSGCKMTAIAKSNWVSQLSTIGVFGLTLAIVAFMVFAMLLVINEKAKAEPEVIYPVWLAYFGALFGSAGVLVAAGEAGIFGFDGQPRNEIAHIILRAAHFFLDIEPECFALVALLTFFALTQCCAYVFAGLSGAAQRPRFISHAWKWSMLMIAKALISASAIVLSIEIVGRRYYWVSTEPRHLLVNSMLAMLLLFIGLVAFCFVPLKRRAGNTAGTNLRRFHRFMRRRMRKGQNEVMGKTSKRKTMTLPW